MKIKKISKVVFIGIWFLLSSICVGLSDSEQPLVRFSIKTDKEIYQIGEEIVISISVKNLSSSLYYLQTLRPFLNTELTVINPKGKRFLLADDRGPFSPTDYSAVLPGDLVEYAQLKIKSDSIEGDQQTGSEPFSLAGTYEINCTYQDLTPFLERALKGTFLAQAIKISLVSLNPLIQEKIAEKTGIKTKLKPAPAGKIQPLPVPIGKEEAIILATAYIKKQKDYQKKGMDFLFVSDSAENGYWVVSFEEKKTKIFHAVKVNEKTGDSEEAFFLE